MFSKEEKLLYSLSALNEVIKTFEIDVNVTLTINDNQYTINAYKEIEKCVVGLNISSYNSYLYRKTLEK